MQRPYEKKTLSTCRKGTIGEETQKKNNYKNTWDDADMIWEINCK